MDREAAPAARKRLPAWVKIVAAVLVVAGLILALRALPVASWLASFQGWVKDLGALGYLLYVLIYLACCLVLGPAWILTVGAGAIYGLWVGTAVVLTGATLGATVAFLLARTLLRQKVEKMAVDNPKVRALDRAIGKEGAKIVFLIRLSPIFPFTYVNYAFGLTSVKTVRYILASLIGMIPFTFAYVYIGWAAKNAASGEVGTVKTIIQIVGAAAALGVTVVVARLATRAIKKAGVEE